MLYFFPWLLEIVSVWVVEGFTCTIQSSTEIKVCRGTEELLSESSGSAVFVFQAQQTWGCVSINPPVVWICPWRWWICLAAVYLCVQYILNGKSLFCYSSRESHKTIFLQSQSSAGTAGIKWDSCIMPFLKFSKIEIKVVLSLKINTSFYKIGSI